MTTTEINVYLADYRVFQATNGVVINEIMLQDGNPDLSLLGAQLLGSQYWGEMNLEVCFDIEYFFGIARVQMKEHRRLIEEAFEAYLSLEQETVEEDA
jgi:hypothetical protein